MERTKKGERHTDRQTDRQTEKKRKESVRF